MFRCFRIGDILENPEYESLFRSFTSRKLEAKYIVYDSNTDENSVFVVLAGELRAYISYEGREFTLFSLEVGDIFVTHSRMTVETKTPSEILVTSMANFLPVLTTIPELSQSIISSLCRGLGQGISVIEGLVFRDVKQRLVNFLVDYAKEYGHPMADGTAITIDYSTEDIAARIGSTRQSTSLTFNELVRDGYVLRVNRKMIIIRDMDTLKREFNVSAF